MTQKEYTGPEEFTGEQFEIEFARSWLAYVEAGKVGVDPHRNWEFRSDQRLRFESVTPSVPPFSVVYQFRWKPKRMVTIGYPASIGANFGQEWISKELVAPEVEAPPIGTHVFIAGHYVDIGVIWGHPVTTHQFIEDGLVFLTREDAQAMADWLAVCRKGGQS